MLIATIATLLATMIYNPYAFHNLTAYDGHLFINLNFGLLGVINLLHILKTSRKLHEPNVLFYVTPTHASCK